MSIDQANKDPKRRCINCKSFNMDGTCNDTGHIISEEGNRIKHPALSWCVNIELKTEKERER